MSALAEIAIKISLIMLAALAATALLRTRSAALRHWILAAAFLAASAVPLAALIMPAWHVPPRAVWTSAALEPVGDELIVLRESLRVSGPVAAGVPHQPAPSPRAPSASIPAILTAVWAAGATLSLGLLIIGFARLTRRAGRAQRIADGRLRDLVDQIAFALGVRRPVSILLSDEPTLSVTWGFAPPKVILPAAARDWSDDRVRIVLAHELAHVHRHDWALQIVAEVLRSICWFNPLVRVACRRLRRESEQACDDTVLGLGVTGADYAAHLLALARSVGNGSRRWVPALAMAHTDGLERRVKAMLNAHQNRRPITRVTRLAAAAVVVALTLSIAGYRTAAQTLSTFSGTVFDSTGRVVPDVTLVLTGIDTAAVHEARSNQDGRFEFQGLAAGSYVLENLSPGFRKALGKLKLAGQHLQQDVTLQVGTLQETVTVRGEPGSTSTAAPGGLDYRAAKREAEGCVAATTGGSIRTPRKLRDVRPVYPRELQDAGVVGSVVLDATIGRDGAIREVGVVGTAHPGLVAAAIDAVRQWEFDWTLLNCEPIEVSMIVTVNFTM